MAKNSKSLTSSQDNSLKDVTDMTQNELVNELLTPKSRKQSYLERNHSHKHLKKYLKAFGELFK